MNSTSPQRKPNMLHEALRFAKACLKSWRTFIICFVAVMCLAGIYLLVRNPKQDIAAQLMLPPESTNGGMMALTDMMGFSSMGDIFGGSSTENEVSMLQSHAVFEKTARDLKLNIAYFQSKYFMDWLQVYDDQVRIRLDVDPAIADTLTKSLAFKLREDSKGKFSITVKRKYKTIYDADGVELPATVHLPYGDFTFTKTPAFDNPEEHISRFNFGFSSYNAAAQSYVENVEIYAPSKKTDFICLNYSTHNPEFGKKLLSTIIDNYNLVSNTEKNDKNAINLNFVNKRIAGLEAELAQAEASMQKFKELNKITEPEADITALMQKDLTIEGTLIEAVTENEVLKMTRDFLLDSKNDGEFIPELGGIFSTPAGESNETPISRYNELVLRIKDREMQFQNTEGDYEHQLSVLHLGMMKKSLLETINRAIAASDTKVKEIQRKANETSARLNSIPAAERDYVVLERELIIKQQLYLFLLKQKEESEMSLAKVMPSLLTIDEPYTITVPSGLTPKLVIALAFVLSILLAMAYVYLRRLKKQPYLSAAGLADATDAPILGNLTATTSALPVAERGNEGDSLRNLRAMLLPVLANAGGNALLVTSAAEGEGKTYTATNLAAALALAGYRTVYVNGDLRSESEPLSPDGRNAATLCSLIFGESSPAEVGTCAIGNASLAVLPAGRDNGHNPADALSSPRLNAVIKALKAEYDYVIIDSADTTEQSDTFAFADCVDATAIVVRVGVSTPLQTAADNALYAAGRFPRIAMVINQ